ncbi:hypothetical protein MGALJ_19780 [Mycobacterium gallinarum]|uniref:Uncharacterized protein n=1 Tax=Mycobacterium gallinarum TaxID=39689 RepID=A0A9W4BH74_9MYCO|nr:hypothetical protein [Mycobacterium gallinarum]BBY92309.1 hypothetical protein MGALJ_19780 [Mycobacterium gallinarum]
MIESSQAVDLLRSDPQWRHAVANLRDLKRDHGAHAETRAQNYAAEYDNARGAMIVDVVASRQRRYSTRVRKIVADWKARNAEHTIAWLATQPLQRELYGLSDGEVTTIHEVANQLCAFVSREGITAREEEDRLCRIWADRYGAIEHAPRLDPVVGSVKGIGLALFAYARMRSGADAIKPDIRVVRAMRSLGFLVPKDEHAVLLITRAAAEEIGMSRLVLDQLLWWRDNDDVPGISGQIST